MFSLNRASEKTCRRKIRDEKTVVAVRFSVDVCQHINYLCCISYKYLQSVSSFKRNCQVKKDKFLCLLDHNLDFLLLLILL